MGAGWHEGEHEAFGIPLPPMAERFDRFESGVATVAALLSDAARTPPGVTRDDPFYPLRGATNEPPPVRPGGPPIWLGGQRRRGIALAVRYGDGWPMPGNRPGRRRLLRAEARRDPAGARGSRPRPGRVHVRGPAELRHDGGRSAARHCAVGLAFVRAGAGHVILGLPASAAPGGLADVAREVAEPLVEAAAPGRRMIPAMTDETTPGEPPDPTARTPPPAGRRATRAANRTRGPTPTVRAGSTPRSRPAARTRRLRSASRTSAAWRACWS